MDFREVLLERCFRELWGFVLLDPQRLDEVVDNAVGKDLMALFSIGDFGDHVTADGIAVPILNLTAGYYTILLRDQAQPTPCAEPAVSSTGWVLGTQTGDLMLCGAGDLTNWDPDAERHRRITIPPGWYRLDIDGYVLGPESADDYALVMTLSRTATPPAFTADMIFDFSLP